MADNREIRRLGRTILDGPHLVATHVRHCGAPETLILSESGSGHPEIAALLQDCPASAVVVLSDGLFRELSGIPNPVGIMAVVAIPNPPAGVLPASCILLDAVQDAGNVGTILRTAAAAGVKDVVLGTGCAGAWTPRVLRAAQGAHYSLCIREQVDLKALLLNHSGVAIAAVARSGVPVYELDIAGDVAWIFGNEGSGIAEEVVSLASVRTTIPLAVETESLNVAVAAGICLFEAVRQQALRKGG